MAAGGASSSVRTPGGQFSAGAAVVLSSLRATFGRSVVPPPHILTIHVATILTHVAAKIWVALRSLRWGW